MFLLFHKYHTKLKNTCYDKKQSSLLCRSVNDEEEKKEVLERKIKILVELTQVLFLKSLI
jgi:hypothetical protein